MVFRWQNILLGWNRQYTKAPSWSGQAFFDWLLLLVTQVSKMLHICLHRFMILTGTWDILGLHCSQYSHRREVCFCLSFFFLLAIGVYLVAKQLWLLLACLLVFQEVWKVSTTAGSRWVGKGSLAQEAAALLSSSGLGHVSFWYSYIHIIVLLCLSVFFLKMLSEFKES